MKIAIDTRSLGANNADGYGYFLYEVLKRIGSQHKEDEFLLFFDRAYHSKYSFDKNVRIIVTGPAISNPLLLKLWYDVKLPALLKKLQVDILVAGPGICSLVTRVRQCVVINDLSFLYFPSFFKRTELFFLKRYTKRFVQKANRVITVSAYLEKEIMNRYAVGKEKISVVHGAARNFHAVTESEKDEIRGTHTDGKNYFLYCGEIDQRKNLVNLLKAFSVFKKRQKSDWKLVLAGNIAPGYKSFTKSIKSYKYRDELVVLDHISEKETARLVAAAWVLIHPAICEGSGGVVFDALQQNVPVISAANSAIAEIAADAALNFDASNYSDIAEKMMMLYKDETMRNKLVENGKRVVNDYSWDKTASIFWDVIKKTMD